MLNVVTLKPKIKNSRPLCAYWEERGEGSLNLGHNGRVINRWQSGRGQSLAGLGNFLSVNFFLASQPELVLVKIKKNVQSSVFTV